MTRCRCGTILHEDHEVAADKCTDCLEREREHQQRNLTREEINGLRGYLVDHGCDYFGNTLCDMALASLDQQARIAALVARIAALERQCEQLIGLLLPLK